MRREPLLTAMPRAPVQNLFELYAIALDLAERAMRHYGALAARGDEGFWPVRCVFEVLAVRERDRIGDLEAACSAACGRLPVVSDLRWMPIDLVPAQEMAEIGDSGLSTPYMAWALAVRHRQRAFVFWTYVLALAVDPAVRRTAEAFAREALYDGNLLRRERRLAWRSERGATSAESEEQVSAALLESLLRRDIVAWSRGLAPAERTRLLDLGLVVESPEDSVTLEDPDAGADLDAIKRRALRRAEQLSNLYLDDADRAADQDAMELAQKLAARSIIRLANLRGAAGVVR
jgi:hypothetical protein